MRAAERTLGKANAKGVIMARTKVEPTGSFHVVDEKGDTHTVTVFTTFIEHAPLSGPAQWLPGTRAHKLRDGSHLNPNDDGTFEVAATGKVMRRL